MRVILEKQARLDNVDADVDDTYLLEEAGDAAWKER